MDESHKKILMASVVSDTFKNVKSKFNEHKIIIQDENFFDYELLKAALNRKQQNIIYFLLKLGCRVKNPNKVNEETPLHLAVKYGNDNIIKKILLNNASVYDKNENGETPIYAAFKQGNHRAAKSVLNFLYIKNAVIQIVSPADFKEDPTNVDNIIHFHIACVMNYLDFVKQYLESGFDINSMLSFDSVEFSGLNPVHYAAIKDYSTLFECFLKHGADLSIKNRDGLTVLHIYYYRESIQKIENIFYYGNETKLINCVDNNGVSHFHLCCMTDNQEHVKVFINKGVDVNSAVSLSCSNYPGFTPLHFAIMNGLVNIVQLLLESGADCNKADKEGITPLHLVCNKTFNASSSIAEMLLNYGACVSAVDEGKSTPLHYAFYNFRYHESNIIDMLISKIPQEVNFIDSKGLSYFHIVCTGNNKIRVEEFLKSGVAVNSRVKSGRFRGFTALHFAASFNQIGIVQLLLNWNAQVNFKTDDNVPTPLHLACECNFMKVKEIYNQYKEAQSNNKSTDIDWTLNRSNQLNIIKLLLLHGADVENNDYESTTALLNTCNQSDNFFIFHQFLDAFSKDSCLRDEIHFRIIKVVEILLLNKANINARNRRQESILHVINRNHYLDNSEELVTFLITKGADVHATDAKGYTPLQNAVIIQKKKLIEVYLKYKADINAKAMATPTPLELLCQNCCMDSRERDILCTLLENGSDVNVRINNGRTILQDAIESYETFVVEKLFYYGADINMEDSKGNLSISFLFTLASEMALYFSDPLTIQLFQIVFVHVQKLLALGHYVHEKIQQSCIMNFHVNYKLKFEKANGIKNLDCVYDNCIEELNRMKLVKIDNYTSLYSILLKDTHELSKYVKNEVLLQILEDPNIDDNFPLYAYLLKVQFKKGLVRSDALQSANAALFSAIGLLPDLCYDSILRYLTNEEIAHLKAAATTSSKRKINDPSKMEFPNKIAKTE